MIGDGTAANVKENISKLGTNMLTLRVGQERRGAPKEDNTAKAFSEDDISAIKNEIQNIKAVAAENSSSVNIVYGNKSNSSSVIGTSNDYFIIKNWELSAGRIFDGLVSIGDINPSDQIRLVDKILYIFFNKLHGFKLIKPTDLNTYEKKTILIVCSRGYKTEIIKQAKKYKFKKIITVA